MASFSLQGPGMARKFSAPGQLCISMTSNLGGSAPISAASATSLGHFTKSMCPPQPSGCPAPPFGPPWRPSTTATQPVPACGNCLLTEFQHQQFAEIHQQPPRFQPADHLDLETLRSRFGGRRWNGEGGWEGGWESSLYTNY